MSSKIVDRVRKLLALAADAGATEAEAALASERARQIMMDHGLSEATIEMSGGEGEARVQESDADLPSHRKWHPRLMAVVAETCFCHAQMITRPGARSTWTGTGYSLIGRASAVATARGLFDYLVRTVERASRDHDGDRVLFQRGMAERLGERLHERYEHELAEQSRKAREQEAAARHPSSAGSGALVVVMEDYAQRERDLNEDLRHGMPPGTTARERDEAEQRRARREQERAEKLTALVADGVPEEVAYYMAMGYDRAEAEKLAKPSEPRRSANRGGDDRWWRRAQRSAAKRESPSWRAGRSTGDSVGLDKQVRADGKKLGG